MVEFVLLVVMKWSLHSYGGPSAAPAIRQSQFFRAVKLPIAALRALGPVRTGGGTSAVREEFLNCQEAAALEESNATGMTSVFRRLVLDDPGVAAESDSWRRARDLYRSGRIEEAIRSLNGAGGDEAYARGLMLLEIGQVQEARRAFESALTGDGAALKIAARFWLDQLSPGKKGSTAVKSKSAASAVLVAEGS
ncbi:hypothetical protein AYO47_09920 [Planctomyces sp. SCGC AG-212-M04]|nr:hypothetical protein AYO47_09920 [Planctomyces sp. SCGC AG-212-M04]